MSELAEETASFNRIPEACLSHVLSFTSPRDSCISSTVSTTFKSALDSDTVWEKFLPSDYQKILNGTTDVIKFTSKRDLYFKLCSPVLIDGGKMSFQLEKSSGAKCFMISAEKLSLACRNNWEWITLSDIRFQKVGYLKFVCWLELSVKIESEMLTTKTRYAAYLVYRLDGRSRGLSYPAHETTIKVGLNKSKNYVRLNPYGPIQFDPYEPIQFNPYGPFQPNHYGPFQPNPYGPRYINVRPYQIEEFEERKISNEIKVPIQRNDGWLEIEMGEFYNANGDDGEIHICLLKARTFMNDGITVYGIDVRPKK